MILAIRRGDVQTMSKLAISTSSVETHHSMDDWTALHEAAYYGQAACVKALLKGWLKQNIHIRLLDICTLYLHAEFCMLPYQHLIFSRQPDPYIHGT